MTPLGRQGPSILPPAGTFPFPYPRGSARVAPAPTPPPPRIGEPPPAAALFRAAAAAAAPAIPAGEPRRAPEGAGEALAPAAREYWSYPAGEAAEAADPDPLLRPGEDGGFLDWFVLWASPLVCDGLPVVSRCREPSRAGWGRGRGAWGGHADRKLQVKGMVDGS